MYRTLFNINSSQPILDKKENCLLLINKDSKNSTNITEKNTNNTIKNKVQSKNNNNLIDLKNPSQVTEKNDNNIVTGVDIIRATIISAGGSFNTSFEEATKEIEVIKKTSASDNTSSNAQEKEGANKIEIEKNKEVEKVKETEKIKIIEKIETEENTKKLEENNNKGKKMNCPLSNLSKKKKLIMPLHFRLYESQNDEVSGTIVGPPDENFHAEKASKALREALSGNNQNVDKLIIDILLSFNNFQRQKILVAYEGMYNRNLQNDIEEETGGFFLQTLLALIRPTHVYLAQILYYSISSRSYNRSIAVEIALTSTASQLKVIRNVYQTEFNVTLEKDIAHRVEGIFGQMLQQLLLRTKDFNDKVDHELANQEVEQLYNSTRHNWIEEIGQNFKLFSRIFGSQSLKQIRAFLDRYDAYASLNTDNESIGKDFETLVRKCVNLYSDIRQMLLLFARISRNIPLYFAEKLHEAFFGTKSDHESIIRILVSRSEIDLYDICDEYKRKYGYLIVSDLQTTCSGDFLRLLSLLVDPTHNNDYYKTLNN